MRTLGSALLVACTVQRPISVTEPEGTTRPRAPEHAPQALVATVRGRAPSDVNGTVQLIPSHGDVRVRTEMTGLPAGSFAHHVHRWGDCSALWRGSPGEAYAFDTTATIHDVSERVAQQTMPEGQREQPRRTVRGNLGELQADAEGRIQSELVVEDLKAWSLPNLLGRSVVVHRGGNRPVATATDLEDAVACGVLGRASPAARRAASGDAR